MEKNNTLEKIVFSSPLEEIKYLKERILITEKKLEEKHVVPDREGIIRSEIRKYAGGHPDEVLEKGYGMLETQAKEIVLELAPETHDKKMEELLGILEVNGLRNSLHILSLMQNPHVSDDFHRFLVQYIKSGLPVRDLKEGERLSKTLRHTLFEVALPLEEDEGKKPLKELLASMEQFLSGIVSVQNNLKDDSVTLEIANPEGTTEAIFYVSVPDTQKEVFEKQLLAIFPKARMFEKKDDYNIFNYDGVTACAGAHFSHNAIFPIKTYESLEYDPLNILLNAFSKIDRDGEGASIQLVLSPDFDGYLGRFREALYQIERGVPLEKAIDIGHGMLSDLGKTAKNMFIGGLKDMVFGGSKDIKQEKEKSQTSKMLTSEIEKKVSVPIVHANIRIVASAKTSLRASEILSSLEASFNQFHNTFGNRITFVPVAEKNKGAFLKNFSFREFDGAHSLPLSLREVTSVLHFPTASTTTPNLKISKSATAPAPIGMPSQGVLLGMNNDRNTITNIHMSSEDRLRHMYVIGQTGTGKTTLLKNTIIQDIKNGEGVCMIDPHGSDIEDILANIPPERYEDVIYFDPGYAARPMALNMLEYDERFPEQKTFVVNEMMSIFNKLFDMKTAGGPMFEQYFRNSVLLAMDDVESGNTLLDVSRILASKQFRDLKISKCKNPIVVQFWTEIASKAGGEASLANIVPYITSKFDVFLTNDIMRPIISQEKSSFNFREIMDTKKILLVNLSKGRLGDINANLIGLILVGKILMAALSRVDSIGKDLPPFYLYIDEFQNITTNSIAQILSEARKYKLSLTIAHQFIAQISDEIKDAVFGNVGSIASFRVGSEDAEYLEKQFLPVFTAKDLMNLDNRNAYMKLLVSGKPVRPFSMETIPPSKGDVSIVPKLKELSYLVYGKERSEVELEILKKYEKKEVPPPVLPQVPNPFSSLPKSPNSNSPVATSGSANKDIKV
jgi:hypothetical protein